MLQGHILDYSLSGISIRNCDLGRGYLYESRTPSNAKLCILSIKFRASEGLSGPSFAVFLGSLGSVHRFGINVRV